MSENAPNVICNDFRCDASWKMQSFEKYCATILVTVIKLQKILTTIWMKLVSLLSCRIQNQKQWEIKSLLCKKPVSSFGILGHPVVLKVLVIK
jgi:hypothetical protein